jgi:hypothetical protein
MDHMTHNAAGSCCTNCGDDECMNERIVMFHAERLEFHTGLADAETR